MVAEKPSVAKLLAEHLSGGRLRTRRGQSRANQIFEFIKYFGPAQQKCKLMVTSVVGHIYGLNFEVSFVLYPWTLLWYHISSFLLTMLSPLSFIKQFKQNIMMSGRKSARSGPVVSSQDHESCGGHNEKVENS